MFSRRDLLTSLAGAAMTAWPLAAASQAQDAAVGLVQAFYDSVQSATAQGADPKQRAATLGEAVTRTFDLGAMARLAVGPRWSSIPAAKQASLQEAFRGNFIATSAARLGSAAGGRFEVLPQTEARAGGKLVRTRVTDSSGRATPVDYLVNQEGRVVDIYLNGTISEIATRRSEFDAPLKAGGPDALEAYLRKRTEELSKGR